MAERLVEIARYPVKSLRGEVVSSAEIELDGVRGDRCWGIHDETTGKILTRRGEPQLLFAAAALGSDGIPVITLPTGVTCVGPGAKTDAALSEWLDKPVRVVKSVGAPAASLSTSRTPPTTRARPSNGPCPRVASSTRCLCSS